MTLFLDGIFDDNRIAPSTVVLHFPLNTGGTSSIRGLLTSEPTMMAQNKWGPILNDITNIQDIASLLGSQEMWSWIGASVMCWKGTEPIKTNIEFYLINYKPGLKLEERLKELSYLTSLYDVGKKVAVKVHGGYQADVLESNRDIFNNGKTTKKDSTKDRLSAFQDVFSDEEFGQLGKGTVSVRFGNKMSLRNMLIQRLDVTPSIVEVADKHGNDPHPLYYRVSVGLIGSRPLLSTDVDQMFSVQGV